MYISLPETAFNTTGCIVDYQIVMHYYLSIPPLAGHLE
jgi:hypothetical protein